MSVEEEKFPSRMINRYLRFRQLITMMISGAWNGTSNRNAGLYFWA